MGRSVGSTSNPPLDGGEGGSVNDELIRLWVKGGGGLQSWNIRAVTKLSHGEAAVHALEGERPLLQQSSQLLRGGLTAQGTKEKAILQRQTDTVWDLVTKQAGQRATKTNLRELQAWS